VEKRAENQQKAFSPLLFRQAIVGQRLGLGSILCRRLLQSNAIMARTAGLLYYPKYVEK